MAATSDLGSAAQAENSERVVLKHNAADVVLDVGAMVSALHHKPAVPMHHGAWVYRLCGGGADKRVAVLESVSRLHRQILLYCHSVQSVLFARVLALRAYAHGSQSVQSVLPAVLAL